MRAKPIAVPAGGYYLTAGSILLLGAFFYVFLGAAPVTGVVFLHRAFALEGLISLDGFFALGHMATYGVLTLGLCAIFGTAGARLFIAAALTGTGIAIEILQEEVFGRQFQIGDVAANTAGIVAALMVLSIITGRGKPQAIRS